MARGHQVHSALALVALSCLSCQESTPTPDTGETGFPGNWAPPAGFWSYTGPDRLLLLESDATFEMGAYGVADPLAGTWVAQGGYAHSDAVAACAGPWLLIINRLYGDNLQFVDPESGATVAQWSTGNGSNPRSALFYGDRAFVTLYEEPYILVADWQSGEELSRIDLSPWADDDGIPEASTLFVLSDSLWVTLERMDRELSWQPAGGSLLLGIDPEDLEVHTEITLPLDNPTGNWNLSEQQAIASAVGAFENDGELALDGGLFQVDLGGSASTSVLLEESTVELNIYDALVDDSTAWLSGYDEDWSNHIQIWNLSRGTRVAEVGTGFYPGWTRNPDGDVWLADHNSASLVLWSWSDARELESMDTLLYPANVTYCGAF